MRAPSGCDPTIPILPVQPPIAKLFPHAPKNQPGLLVQQSFIGHRELGSFNRGKFIALGTVDLPYGERHPTYSGNTPRPDSTRYGITMEWGCDFALFQLVTYRPRDSFGDPRFYQGVDPPIPRVDTVLSWGNDPANRLRFRFVGPYNPDKDVAGSTKAQPINDPLPDSQITRDIMVVFPYGQVDVNGVLVDNGHRRRSDARFKEAIEPLGGVLDKITAMRGVSFDWKSEDFPEKNFSRKRQLGLIAQEVEELFPDLVSTDEDGHKAVDYDQLTPLLLEAIKEQQKVITAQEARLDRLEGALRKLAVID